MWCKKKTNSKKLKMFIEKIMNNYHFIVLNLVVFCNIHADETQKVCECQNVNFNWSIYTNEFWLQHLSSTFAKIVFSTFFHNNRLCFLFCILTSSVWNFRANSFNDVNFVLSTMRILKFSQRCIVWKFRTNFFNAMNSMRKLQNRTNRNSMIYWFQIWRKIDL